MKRITLFVIFLLSITFVDAQIYSNPNPGSYGIRYNRGKFDSTLHIPTICGMPSGKASLKDAAITNQSAILYDSCGKAFWVYSPSDSSWKNAGGVDTFTTNLKVIGTSFGKYNDGDSIYAKGKTANQVISDAIVKCIAPTYYNPTAGISATPTPGNYEIGSTLNINLSSSYTQNDGGSSTGSTFYQNGTSCRNTVTVSSLTSTQSFYVSYSYNQGACKNNNCGILDCTGRINAGSVNSGTITYNGLYKYYVGTCAGPTPTNAEILAAATQALSTSRVLTINVNGGGNYVFYAYYSGYGNAAISTDLVTDASGSFNKTTSSGFTNTQGYGVTLTVYTTTNPQGGSTGNIYFK